MSREFHDTVMTDCPLWRYDEGGYRRVFDDGAARRLVTVTGCRITAVDLDTGAVLDVDPPSYRFPESLWSSAPELAESLAGLGTVRRFRNHDHWSAVGVAILRQVPLANQVRHLCGGFSTLHGERVVLPGGGEYALFPSAETVVSLPDAGFAAAGLGYLAEPMRDAAKSFLDGIAQWRDLTPGALVEALRRVDGVGAWSASVAVTDVHGDFAYYPYPDLAIRTWARRAAPHLAWPDDDPTFTRLWKHLADGDLSGLTASLLAWGVTHRGH